MDVWIYSLFSPTKSIHYSFANPFSHFAHTIHSRGYVLLAYNTCQPAISVKYMDIACDNKDDKTPKLSVQRIFAGLYSSTEKVRSANEYCTTNDVRWAHVSLILCCEGGPVD